MKNIKSISENTIVFSTGVYLKPQKIKINSMSQWRWVAVGFEDTSFSDGEEIEVYDYSEKVEDLLISSN